MRQAAHRARLSQRTAYPRHIPAGQRRPTSSAHVIRPRHHVIAAFLKNLTADAIPQRISPRHPVRVRRVRSGPSFPQFPPYNKREVTSQNIKKVGYPWGTPPFLRRTEEAEIRVIIISRDAGEKAAQNGDLTGYGILWYNKSK